MMRGGQQVKRARRVLFAVMILVLLLFRSAWAAEWVYSQRLEGTRYGACTEYIDAASVLQRDDKLTYWTLWVFDEDSNFHPIRKILMKKEAKVSEPPQRYLILERYHFNAADEEINRYLEPAKSYGDATEEIQRAAGYATASQADTPRPDHVVVPRPRWYGVKYLEHCNLYWDIRSIVAWPHNQPRYVDIRVKKVWTAAALAERKAWLATRKPYRQDYDGLQYTLVNYRFQLNTQQVKILEETDYDVAQQRMTVEDGSDWQAIKPGGAEEEILRIAQNWLQGTD